MSGHEQPVEGVLPGHCVTDNVLNSPCLRGREFFSHSLPDGAGGF